MSQEGINIGPSSPHFYRIPEVDARQPMSFSGWNYGNLDLMGGKILLQFTPLDSTGLVARLGRNATCLTEVRRLVRGLPLPDIRRTVRTLLRLVETTCFLINLDNNLQPFQSLFILEKEKSVQQRNGEMNTSTKMPMENIFRSWTFVQKRTAS